MGTSIPARVLRALKESGPLGVLERLAVLAYAGSVRPLLPAHSAVCYAGLPIGLDRKILDQFVPRMAHAFRDIPNYEQALVSGLRRHSRKADRVVVVGGGWGVTAVVAALEVGSTGRVTCYEGSSESVVRIQKTVQRNGVTNQVDVHHSVVGEDRHVYGKSQRGRLTPAGKLPECDLLELDCEGAEIAILSEMTIRPRVILVETHGLYGAPTAVVQDLLVRIGYATQNLGPAEPQSAQFCKDNDIYVLAGLAVSGAQPEA